MRALAPLTLAFLLCCSPTLAQKERARSPRILNAKAVYFFNRTGSDAVGAGALAALKKWNRFQIVTIRPTSSCCSTAIRIAAEISSFLGDKPGLSNATVKSPKIPSRITPRQVPPATHISTLSTLRTAKASGAPIIPGAACSPADAQSRCASEEPSPMQWDGTLTRQPSTLRRVQQERRDPRRAVSRKLKTYNSLPTPPSNPPLPTRYLPVATKSHARCGSVRPATLCSS
jgi:hypothetical protein